MKRERRPVSIGERWRRLTTRGAEDDSLEKALASLPSIGRIRLDLAPGSIRAEMEGSMGSINEVSVHVPRLPARIWPQVVRVMRRSASMQEAMREGRVPRSFDRLIVRISGESVFPDARRVTTACTCGLPENPCRHALAIHELFARGLEDRPWELLVVRGVELRKLLNQAARPPEEGELPSLAFGAREEPVLFPEGEEGDLDESLSPGQVRQLLGAYQSAVLDVVDTAIRALGQSRGA